MSKFSAQTFWAATLAIIMSGHNLQRTHHDLKTARGSVDLPHGTGGKKKKKRYGQHNHHGRPRKRTKANRGGVKK